MIDREQSNGKGSPLQAAAGAFMPSFPVASVPSSLLPDAHLVVTSRSTERRTKTPTQREANHRGQPHSSTLLLHSKACHASSLHSCPRLVPVGFAFLLAAGSRNNSDGGFGSYCPLWTDDQLVTGTQGRSAGAGRLVPASFRNEETVSVGEVCCSGEARRLLRLPWGARAACNKGFSTTRPTRRAEPQPGRPTESIIGNPPPTCEGICFQCAHMKRISNKFVSIRYHFVTICRWVTMLSPQRNRAQSVSSEPNSPSKRNYCSII
jgi:hypothetical protein